VVTHSVPADAAERWPRTTFVDGVEAAIAKAREIAGDKDVTIASASITQQALDLGLVDEVCVSLVPVLFGEGIPYFTKLDRGHQLLDDPIVIQGRRALHLRYPVRR
jgi:dihydrofolate reductase